ncbi:MAG: HAD family hydrolase [Acutalibacter sp.]
MELLRQPVKGIFFDLGWTLVYPPSGDWEFTQPAQKLFNWEVYQSLPKERTAAVRKEANDYLEAHHHISTLEEEYDRMLQYFTIVAQKLPELGATRQDIEATALEKVYQSQHTYNLMEDAIPTLEALKGRCKLGIISDTWPSIVPVLERFGILPYFDAITYSFQLGCFKPNPRMFQDALSKMGLPAQECVFIDDVARNLEGAAKVGIQPVQVRVKPDADPCPQGMASIGKISGILELL